MHPELPASYHEVKKFVVNPIQRIVDKLILTQAPEIYDQDVVQGHSRPHLSATELSDILSQSEIHSIKRSLGASPYLHLTFDMEHEFPLDGSPILYTRYIEYRVKIEPTEHPAAQCNQNLNLVFYLNRERIVHSVVRHVCHTNDQKDKTQKRLGPFNHNYSIEDEGNAIPELYPPGNIILAKYCQSRSPSFQRLNPPCEHFIRFYLNIGYGA